MGGKGNFLIHPCIKKDSVPIMIKCVREQTCRGSPFPIRFNTGSEISPMNQTKKMASSVLLSTVVWQGRNCAGTCAVRVVKIVIAIEKCHCLSIPTFDSDVAIKN